MEGVPAYAATNERTKFEYPLPTICLVPISNLLLVLPELHEHSCYIYEQSG